MRQRKTVSRTAVPPYESFDAIDGSHSYRDAVPNGCLDYRVRYRAGGSVFYFNFELAKEMGLLPRSHPESMNPELSRKILDTFSLQIINEYDIENGVKIPAREIRKNPCMATRYLQLQHPDKRGSTSGDGRGIWNGEVRHRGKTWDILSSGTGATRLSPAYASTGKFIKTGDPNAAYGNGYNYLQDGLSAALMSEAFHRDGIETERTLAIISFEGGSSINVRAGKNLLRPAHFFHFLKQGKLEDLRRSVDYFIERQLRNGELAGFEGLSARRRYERFAEYEALTFSSIAARFESDYVFCWLDWDGDNILANGGIIDYGSVRRFGLYHHEYRYDDVDRMSTTIPEQKGKARYIVQNFAQIRDFLITGEKRPIDAFRNDPLLKTFDENFQTCLRANLLSKLGFSHAAGEFLLKHHSAKVARLKSLHSGFEKTRSRRGTYSIADGITSDAVFCMANLHRELPKRFAEKTARIPDADFIAMLKSSYAKPRDLKATRTRARNIKAFQKHYLKLVRLVAAEFHSGSAKRALLELMMRASVKNPAVRVTGDGILHVTTSLIRNQKKLSIEEKSLVIRSLIEGGAAESKPASSEKVEKIIHRNLKALKDLSEGL